MKKWTIIIMLILSVGIVYGLEDCKDLMVSTDPPCIVKSSWEFHPCDAEEVRIFNSTGDLLTNLTLGDYGDTGRCNITFNFTTIGSYTLNWTTGDSSHIIIQVDDEMHVAIAIVLSVFSVLFILLGIFLYNHFKEQG